MSIFQFVNKKELIKDNNISFSRRRYGSTTYTYLFINNHSVYGDPIPKIIPSKEDIIESLRIHNEIYKDKCNETDIGELLFTTRGLNYYDLKALSNNMLIPDDIKKDIATIIGKNEGDLYPIRIKLNELISK